jgi:hypothetical protein
LSVNYVRKRANGVVQSLTKKTISLMDEQVHMEEASHYNLDVIIDEVGVLAFVN